MSVQLRARQLSDVQPPDNGEGKVWTVYRGTSLDRTSLLKPETQAKVKAVWDKAKDMIARNQGDGLRINFTKGFISFKDADGKEHRLDQYTDENARALLKDIKEISKELQEELQGKEAAPTEPFQTPSSNWQSVRPRSHDDCSQAISKHLKTVENRLPEQAVLLDHVGKRMNATNRFIEKLIKKMEEKTEELELRLEEENLPAAEKAKIRTQIKSIDRLKQSLQSIDETGTRDAIYWAVCAGEMMPDENDIDSSTRPEKAKQIAGSMIGYLHSLLEPSDNRWAPTKRLGLRKPVDERGALQSDISAYAQNTGDLVYTESSIEHFVVHAMMRTGEQLEESADELWGTLGLELSNEEKDLIFPMIQSARNEANTQ